MISCAVTNLPLKLEARRGKDVTWREKSWHIGSILKCTLRAKEYQLEK
jgi:hypothetical protein